MSRMIKYLGILWDWICSVCKKRRYNYLDDFMKRVEHIERFDVYPGEVLEPGDLVAQRHDNSVYKV